MDAIKEVVVLLHCSGSSGAQWRSLEAKIGGRYRVLAPDLRSCGGLAQEAAPIVAMIERLGEPAHLVGHSYGGGVALHIARTRPELLHSLTLIEPSAFHLLRGGDTIDAAALREIMEVALEAKTSLAAGDHSGGFGRFVDYWKPGSWEAMPAEKRAALAPQLAKVTLDFRALLGERAEIDDVRQVAVPTLLLQGGCTRLPSRCVVHRLRSALPQVSYRVIQGAGHMLPVTHREQVNPLIDEHIGANGAATLREAA
jgi:pimeloyl-ACP methyl ester carboxylesterase